MTAKEEMVMRWALDLVDAATPAIQLRYIGQLLAGDTPTVARNLEIVHTALVFTQHHSNRKAKVRAEAAKAIRIIFGDYHDIASLRIALKTQEKQHPSGKSNEAPTWIRNVIEELLLRIEQSLTIYQKQLPQEEDPVILSPSDYREEQLSGGPFAQIRRVSRRFREGELALRQKHAAEFNTAVLSSLQACDELPIEEVESLFAEIDASAGRLNCELYFQNQRCQLLVRKADSQQADSQAEFLIVAACDGTVLAQAAKPSVLPQLNVIPNSRKALSKAKLPQITPHREPSSSAQPQPSAETPEEWVEFYLSLMMTPSRFVSIVSTQCETNGAWREALRQVLQRELNAYVREHEPHDNPRLSNDRQRQNADLAKRKKAFAEGIMGVLEVAGFSIGFEVRGTMIPHRLTVNEDRDHPRGRYYLLPDRATTATKKNSTIAGSDFFEFTLMDTSKGRVPTEQRGRG